MPCKVRATRYISKAHEGTGWHTFGYNHARRFIYDCRDFDTLDEVLAYAQRARRRFNEGSMIENLTEQS